MANTTGKRHAPSSSKEGLVPGHVPSIPPTPWALVADADRRKQGAGLQCVTIPQPCLLCQKLNLTAAERELQYTNTRAGTPAPGRPPQSDCGGLLRRADKPKAPSAARGSSAIWKRPSLQPYSATGTPPIRLSTGVPAKTAVSSASRHLLSPPFSDVSVNPNPLLDRGGKKAWGSMLLASAPAAFNLLYLERDNTQHGACRRSQIRAGAVPNRLTS